MKTVKLILVILLFNNSQLFAQHARFVYNGTITYEKRINMNAVMRKNMANAYDAAKKAFEQYKQNKPQFKVLKSTLTFAGGKTLFTPEADREDLTILLSNIDPSLKQPNVVYTDLINKKRIIEKTVFEKVFQVRDTVRKITWKFTDETRTIMGYNCRRANAVVSDSIYVVAFYADRIPVTGGPESFSGLPGMILELVIPHDNITWEATAVTENEPVNIPVPSKGEVITTAGLRNQLQSLFKNWGDRSKSYWKALLL